MCSAQGKSCSSSLDSAPALGAACWGLSAKVPHICAPYPKPLHHDAEHGGKQEGLQMILNWDKLQTPARTKAARTEAWQGAK